MLINELEYIIILSTFTNFNSSMNFFFITNLHLKLQLSILQIYKNLQIFVISIEKNVYIDKYFTKDFFSPFE